MAIAGRVAIVPKGDWSADATYKRLDAVTHNNTLYFAKKDVPAGTETSNTEYWSKSIVGSVVTVDDALSPTSTNPVQNKVVTSNLTDLKKETTVNLLNPTLQTTTQNGVTCTNNGDGTYTLNGTATSSDAGFNLIGREGGNSVWLTMPADGKIIYLKGDATYKIGCAAFKSEDGAAMSAGGIIPKGTNIRNIYFSVLENQTLNNVLIKPMLTTNLSATYDDFVPYTGDTGRLNGDVAELKAQSVKKDNVVNNQTTTEEGFALDARQANPNIDGSLAKQISDLNGSLNNTFITSNMNVGLHKQLRFDFSSHEQIVFMWFFYPVSTNSVSLYAVVHHNDAKIQLISAIDDGYNPKILNSNGTVSISFDNNYMGYMMFSTSKLDITVC